MFLLYLIMMVILLGGFSLTGAIVSPLFAQIWLGVAFTVSALIYCLEGPKSRK